MLGYWEKETNAWDYPINWTISTAINKNSSNVLKVVAKGSAIQVFINGQLQGSITNSRLSSGKAGVSVNIPEAGKTAVIEMDNYYLTNLQD